MANKISPEEARSVGIETNHEVMDNGERRFRLLCSDGSSYCRTEASDQGAWQNSHYHKALHEFYVVQTGWMIYAEYEPHGVFKLHFIGQGEQVTLNPRVHHNIYMSANTVIHTIKYGSSSGNDWYPSPELDLLTKHLPESDLIRLMP